MPLPMTTTGDAAFWLSETASPTTISPLSPPSNPRSSNSRPASRSSTGRRPRKLIISRNASRESSTGTQPPLAIGGNGGEGATTHLRHVRFGHRTLNVR